MTDTNLTLLAAVEADHTQLMMRTAPINTGERRPFTVPT
jgi:hypothetical protein